MKKRILCILLSGLLFVGCFTVLPTAAAVSQQLNLTSYNGWLCGGVAAQSPVTENSWGTYVFDESGASVICSDKGYTNIMYRLSNVDFDSVKGMLFSVSAVSARWDIKLRKGTEDEVSYSGVWNGMNTNESYSLYDFSRYNWTGVDDLCIYFYSIGSAGTYVKFENASLTDTLQLFGVGDTVNTNSFAGWTADGNAITVNAGSAKNGTYQFSESGVNVSCVQNTLYYFNITKKLLNVDLNSIKGLSYKVSCADTSRWDIKIYNKSNSKNTAHASGGVWNGIAGSLSGYVDFSQYDWTGISTVQIELYVIGNGNSATFDDLTFISYDGLDAQTVDLSSANNWDTKSAEGIGSYSFTSDGISLTQTPDLKNMYYSISTKKMYLNLDHVNTVSYLISAKNTRWVIEVTNTTIGETIRINPTWAGFYGSRSGAFSFNEYGWKGNVNISITLSAVGVEGASKVTLHKLCFTNGTPQENDKIPLSDRDEADVTGEGDVDICDVIESAKCIIEGQKNSFADKDNDGTVTLSDLSNVKKLVLSNRFFDNTDYIVTLDANTVISVDCTKLDNTQKTMVTALQGLVNRNGPKLYLQTGLTSYLNAFDTSGYNESGYDLEFLERYGSGGVEAFWEDEIKKDYGYRFVSLPVRAVLDVFSECYSGVVKYDESITDANGNVVQSESRTNAAITSAGIYSALPVSPRLYKQYYALHRLNTVLDLRSRFEDRLQSTEWAINNLLPNCSKEFVSSYFYEGENGTWQNDYAVMNKAFCYELNSVVSGNLNHVGDEEAKTYNPEEEALLNRILNHVDKFGFVWGWGQGGENALASVTAMHGLELVCANMANGSFYSGLPVNRTDFIQPNMETVDIQPQNKFYISFMMNEGDSFKAMANLYGGTWTQNARGDIPIAWGVDSLVLDKFPFFADYYYKNSSSNDYYFAAASGYGYIHPYFLPVSLQDEYAEKTRIGALKYGLEYVDIWWFSLAGNTNKWEWLAKTGMKGITQWSSYNSTEYRNGMPVIHSQLYYPSITIWTDRSYKQRSELLADSLRTAKNSIGDKPFCTVIYGGEPQYFKDIADNLPPDQFEIVSLNTLYAIAKKCESGLSGVTAVYDFEKASAGEWDPSEVQQ